MFGVENSCWLRLRFQGTQQHTRNPINSLFIRMSITNEKTICACNSHCSRGINNDSIEWAYTYIYSRSTTTAILHLSKVLILLLLLIPYLLGLYSNIKVYQMRKQYDFKIKEAYFEITRLPKPLQCRFRRLHLPPYTEEQ